MGCIYQQINLWLQARLTCSVHSRVKPSPMRLEALCHHVHQHKLAADCTFRALQCDLVEELILACCRVRAQSCRS